MGTDMSNGDFKTTIIGLVGAIMYTVANMIQSGTIPEYPQLVNAIIIAALGYFSKGIERK